LAAAVAAKSIPKTLAVELKEAHDVRKRFRLSASLAVNTKRLGGSKGGGASRSNSVSLATVAAVAAARHTRSSSNSNDKPVAGADFDSEAVGNSDGGGKNSSSSSTTAISARHRLSDALKDVDEEGAAMAKTRLLRRIDADGNGTLDLQEVRRRRCCCCVCMCCLLFLTTVPPPSSSS
jgi:hypothetical protein